MGVGSRGRFCGICLLRAAVCNRLKVVHAIRFGRRIRIMLFVLLRYIIVSCGFTRYQIGNQTYFLQIHVINNLLRIVPVRLAEINFRPVIIEPLPIKSRKAIHKVKDTLVILRHVGYGRRILGIGNQIDLSILLRRLLYYGREGLIHPRIECPVVLIQYRRACSVNGHSACLAHASNHFHLSDDSLEVITFTRLPMDK